MAIAALHTLNPPMLHLDIKPSNFLVSAISPGEASPLFALAPESRPIASSSWTSPSNGSSSPKRSQSVAIDSAYPGGAGTSSRNTKVVPTGSPRSGITIGRGGESGKGIATSAPKTPHVTLIGGSNTNGMTPSTPTPPDTGSNSGSASPLLRSTVSTSSPGAGAAAAISLTEADDNNSWSFSCKIADLELSVALTEAHAPYVRIPDTFVWTG
jgi:hypothetical protein